MKLLLIAALAVLLQLSAVKVEAYWDLDKRDSNFVVTPERCNTPPSNECMKKVTPYYTYDPETNTCKKVPEGGCIANDNRWELLSNCQTCIQKHPPTSPPKPPPTAPPPPPPTAPPPPPPTTPPPEIIQTIGCDHDQNHVFYIIAAMNDKVIEVPEGATVGSEIRMWTRDPVPNKRQLWYYDADCKIKSFYNNLVFWNHDDGSVENLTLQPLSADVKGHWKIDDWKVYNDNTVNNVITRVLDVRDNNQENGATLITYGIKNLSATDNQHFRTETIAKF